MEEVIFECGALHQAGWQVVLGALTGHAANDCLFPQGQCHPLDSGECLPSPVHTGKALVCYLLFFPCCF